MIAIDTNILIYSIDRHDALKQAMFEEPTRLATLLIQQDRPVTDLLNGDTTLAEHAYPPAGIRSINGKTYGDWFCFSFFGLVLCEPHDNGEIWRSTGTGDSWR